jgi:hypothetical protein
MVSDLEKEVIDFTGKFAKRIVDCKKQRIKNINTYDFWG